MLILWMGLLGFSDAKCTDKECDIPELKECNSIPKECMELGTQYAEFAYKKESKAEYIATFEIAQDLWIFACSQDDSEACQHLSALYLDDSLG